MYQLAYVYVKRDEYQQHVGDDEQYISERNVHIYLLRMKGPGFFTPGIGVKLLGSIQARTW